MKKPSVFVVFLTVFIDLIGFGIVIPLLPIYANNFHAAGWEIGALMASYSLMQFVFAPMLGRLSDRIGRRPVLLFSTLGSAISYCIFAYGSQLQGQTALMVIFASRIFAGICGANIGVAQAYIADISPPALRSKRMGLIGMAFGLGFILGPFIAGQARGIFGVTGPGWTAAALCTINLILTFLILPESREASSEASKPRPQLEQFFQTLKRPVVGLLICVFFLATFAFTCFEATLGLLLIKKFNIDPESAEGIKTTANLFVYAGIIGALFQGGLTGRLVKMLGEPKLVAISLFLVGLSLAPMPFASSWFQLRVLLALLSIGSSMTRPPVFGMISNLTNANEQGMTIGVAQSIGSLARIVGPVFSLVLFYRINYLPYVICAGMCILTGFLVWAKLANFRLTPAKSEELVVEPEIG